MHFLAVGDLSLGFDPGFVNASAAACLVGERPLLAVLPQAQKLAGFPKTAVSEIVKHIEFMSAGCYHMEPRIAKPLFQGRDIGYTKLDFDFVRHGRINVRFRRQSRAYLSRATTNSSIHTRARLNSESGKVQIALRAISA